MSNRLNSHLEIEFKRSVIHKIKSYPVIWDPKSRLHSVWKTDTRAAWDDVQAAVDFPLRRLKLLWASFRRHYFDILIGKTIERDDNLPRWKLFHDMSFMYEIMKRTIAERLGGISPPLFKPQTYYPNDAVIVDCPCCLPIPSSTEVNFDSTELIIGAPQTIAESWKTPIEICDLSDPEDFYQDQTTHSFEEQVSEDSLCQSNQTVILKESSEKSSGQLIQTDAVQEPRLEGSTNQSKSNLISCLNESLSENSLHLHQLITNNSLQGLLSESSINESNQTILLHQPLSENSLSQLIQTNSLQTLTFESSINQPNQTIFFHQPLSENSLSQFIQPSFLHGPLSDSSTNQFNQTILFEAPLPENSSNQDNQTNSLKQIEVGRRKLDIRARKPKPYVPREELSAEREKIINAIRPYPVLYARAKPYQKGSLSFTWKKVAAEVGLPVNTVTNRWRLIKQRYVEEVMRERYANGPFESNWENFKQMSFMREYLKADVDDIDRIRQEIQTLVKEQRSHQTIDLCSDDDDTSMGSNGVKKHLNKLKTIEPRPMPMDINQMDQSIQCDQPALSKENPENSQLSNVASLDLTSDEFENSDPPETDKSVMNSYQQAFEHSLTSIRLVSSNDAIQCAQPAENVQSNPAKSNENQKSDVQVIELDPSSDEEDNVICVDDDNSMTADSEVEMYAGISSVYICPSPEYAPISSVYISPSPVNVPSTTPTVNITEPSASNTICLDDDD